VISSRLPVLPDRPAPPGAPASAALFSPAVRSLAEAFARAVIPDGKVFKGGDARTIERVEAMLLGASPHVLRGFGAVLRMLDGLAVLSTGRRFASLDSALQESLLLRWEGSALTRTLLFVAGSVLKSTHFDDPEVYRAMGCVYQKGGPAEDDRWMSQVTRASELEHQAVVECDAVVVGTGAGGAVVAKELAERGHAVILLEEGEFHRRDEFGGRASEARVKFYRNRGAVAAIGNTIMPIFMGRMVGGSTAINTGTCFRTPPWILGKWCEELGTDELSPEALDPHFSRVEETLRVETANKEVVGSVGTVIGRGSDALGWHHFPVRRNAPDCDGQGVCDYGCPSDARRSTNISYVPEALKRGALLYTGARAESVSIENGRAVGIRARSARGKTFEVRARVVVLAGGAIPTPLLLLSQGIANKSGQVGRNLSTHPATAVSALFGEPIRAYNAAPQGYCVDQFHKEGILLLGASAPLDIGALMFPFHGRRLMETMEAFDRVASFGAMVEDESRGRVRVGPQGRPLITYWLRGEDIERLRRGMIAIAEIFRAAGATRILPLLPKLPILAPSEIDRLREIDLSGFDLMLTSFHPLGTSKMGRDPRTSVIDLDHETHDVRNLFIVDGSAVPGPPAVNPQITIMALATRAAGKISERLDA
jgi:choline dehydrogenase-like flavoprotein